MPTLQEVPTLDISISPPMNSWSSPPAGFLLLIEEAPPTDFFLLIDDEGHRLLIA
jgi:hypothetical protein